MKRKKWKSKTKKTKSATGWNKSKSVTKGKKEKW